jgi:hypothetical protein
VKHGGLPHVCILLYLLILLLLGYCIYLNARLPSYKTNPQTKHFCHGKIVFIQIQDNPQKKKTTKKKYFITNFIHLLHKACQILCTFTNQCHSQCLHFLTLTPNIPILFTVNPQANTIYIMWSILLHGTLENLKQWLVFSITSAQHLQNAITKLTMRIPIVSKPKDSLSSLKPPKTGPTTMWCTSLFPQPHYAAPWTLHVPCILYLIIPAIHNTSRGGGGGEQKKKKNTRGVSVVCL